MLSGGANDCNVSQMFTYVNGSLFFIFQITVTGNLFLFNWPCFSKLIHNRSCFQVVNFLALV